MANKKFDKLEIYFKEALIGMPFASRVLTRIITNIVMTVLIVLTVTFLISSIDFLFWIGCFLLIFLIDRLVHAGEPADEISELPQSGRVNAADYLLSHARNAVVAARERVALSKTNFVLELLNALVEDGEVDESLKRLDVSIAEFHEKLKEYIKARRKTYTKEEIDSFLEKSAATALKDAYLNAADFIGCGDLFSAVAKMDEPEASKLFGLFEIKNDDLEKALIFGRFKRRSWLSSIPKSVGGFASRRLRSRVVNRAWTSRPTPTLDRFAVDYSTMARTGQVGFLIGHDEEYERLLSILSRSTKPNALLVGEPGIGKGAVIGHLAYMISKDKVPRELFDKRLVSLDIGRLVSGANQSELQARIQKIFQEIYQAGNIILHIPNIHNLARTAQGKEISAANTIIPLIVTNDFPMIGTTYPKEHKQYIEADSSFSQAFEAVRVNEISPEDTLKILIYDSFLHEGSHKVTITLGALKMAVQIAGKYFKEKPLPASASDLLKEALSYADRHATKTLSADDVVAVAESRVNIPIKRAGKDEAAKLLNLEEVIHEQLVDQELAVRSVSQALREYRSGLGRHGGPIGAFLFVGPTGVGKTELSKILAKIQFGSEDAMIRFDMSEYQDRQSVFQFVGSPDGAVSGILTERVIEKPYSLILLDEFEKAHPDILNLFLQVFDDGRLTDNLGKVVSFENTIIIATSNAHSPFIKEELEKGRAIEDIGTELKKKLVSFFKPELLNRFSSVVVFKDLSREDIKQIAARQLKSISQSVFESQGIYLNFRGEAVSKIADLGYDPVFGARPLRQVISDHLKDPLSKMILGGVAQRGASINVELEGDKIKLSILE